MMLTALTILAQSRRSTADNPHIMTPPDYARDWRTADSLAAKGLPKSALEIANRIYKEAKAQKNYPQVVKAVMRRMVFRTASDETAYKELVRSLQTDVTETPEPAKSVLQSALAEIYWQYFQQNRYKFYNRATVNTAESQPTKTTDAADFTTWDGRQLIGAITNGYLASVSAKELLQKTPVSTYDALLDKGDADARLLRPTLYDLLAHRAIEFFQNTEPDLLKPIFRFELDKPDYFAESGRFAKLPIQSKDSLSGRYQALRLYQQLIEFHLPDTNPNSLADVDVLRLAFVHQYSVVPERDSIYRKALEGQISRFKNSPIEAIYAYQLALFLADHGQPIRPLINGENNVEPDTTNPNRWNHKRAADICRDLIDRFPKTLNGQRAAELLNRLLEPSYSVMIEQVNVPQQPFRALLTYQNANRILYRVIRLSVAELVEYRDNYVDDTKRKKLVSDWLKRAGVAEKAVTLPDDGDLNQHSVEIPLTGLPIGHYLLLATTDKVFSDKIESLQYAAFTASALGCFIQASNYDDLAQAVFVTNRQTGEPVKGAQVSTVGSKIQLITGLNSAPTNAEGRVQIPTSTFPPQNNFYYLIKSGNDTLITDRQYNYRYSTSRYEETDQTYTRLFTDRAIYRPGQPIYVKGLLYSGKQNQFTVVAGREMEIDFIDQNGEQIAKQTVKTNEFGTFATNFTAPTGRLTGIMTLRALNGSTGIRVEEYKRPTFEVKANPVKEAFKLGQTITLTAQAKTFSGVAVDGAEVRYRVVRKLRPRWDWWYIRPNSSETEIANGAAQTDAQGNVNMDFVASPDRESSRKDNPIFDFEITVDVTDRAGETRSTTKTLRIGYSAVQVALEIPGQVEQNNFTAFPVLVTNQSGERVQGKGQLTIYRLQPPSRILRDRLWNRPDRQFLSRTEFEKLFPNDLYANEADPHSWSKGEIVQQLTITVPADSTIKPDMSRYTPGDYVAELTVTDQTGETGHDQAFFTVTAETQPTASARIDGWLQTRKTTVEPGGEAIFWVGNRQPGWVLMTVEEARKFVRQEWIKTDGHPRRITLPITEKQRGGFAVHFAMVQNGRMYQKSERITVPFSNKQLTIETKTFRDKLKPGEREEWTLTVSGMEKTPAEVVATLYDASLDAFTQLQWATSFYRTYSSAFSGWHSNTFSPQSGKVLLQPYPSVTNTPDRQYDQLGWFGTPTDAIRVAVVRDGRTISGTLKNQDGSGAPGVAVVIRGMSTGATSNGKGEFSLKAVDAKTPVTIVFSYIGYISREITINQEPVSFSLRPDTKSLNEVVAVGYGGAKPGGRSLPMAKMAARAAAPMAADGAIVELKEAVAAEKAADTDGDAVNGKPKPAPDINPRRNFNETAFFLPQLKTDEQGRVVLKFTMPEALTRWRLLAFVHTKDLKTGTLEREIITQKELMITANAPRFLREGDTIRIAARVNNLTDKTLNGSANLLLTDALTRQPIGQKIKIIDSQSQLTLAPGAGQAVGWTLVIPNGLEAVTCRFTAQSGQFTDGEELTIPVLPNRILVTDTQPFWVNGTESKEFKLQALTNLNPELPVQHERLMVEITSNPAWYALQSLPYLMEYRYECAEQLFSRLYANSLATHIVNSKPAFKQVVAEWQKTPPRNPLQSNEELKAVALENSPWLADARSETERQAKLGQLLDANRMEDEQRRAFEKLQQLQASNGGFRWFGGMEPDLSMTLHILSGLGHLQKLGVQLPNDLKASLNEMQTKAIRYADAEMKHWIEEQQKAEAKKKGISSWYFSATQYLYARSFYLDKPVDKAMLAYLKQRVASDWLKQSLQGQALSAMALHRFGDKQTPDGILRSLRERSRESEEMGLYWPDNQSGLSWYQTPIETQAYLIEAFDEIKPDRSATDAMKRWLLRQKQTQSWSSTKATTEAVYALLLRGSDWLGTGITTQASLGGQPIESRVTKADAITGYEKVAYAATEIKPEMGRINITKKGTGPAWGALYWQHFEPLDRVMPGSAGLSLQKTLYVQRDSPNGPVISSLASQKNLKPGDLIKVRLILKTDRAMEYVHVKDGRASGFEPVAALSGYKYQNGLGYYEAPRDASTDFFIGYLPVGTHIFEYELRVAQTGDFSAGVATVQCFYAPEFSAHSAGERVKVK
jgi:uncharacterized protein YfaS (alpha-2-macroglobulin family)